MKIAGVHVGKRYHPSAPRGHCVGHDTLSGLASCTLHRHHHGHHVTYTATATDKAGNTATARVTVAVRHQAITGARPCQPNRPKTLCPPIIRTKMVLNGF